MSRNIIAIAVIAIRIHAHGSTTNIHITSNVDPMSVYIVHINAVLGTYKFYFNCLLGILEGDDPEWKTLLFSVSSRQLICRTQDESKNIS